MITFYFEQFIDGIVAVFKNVRLTVSIFDRTEGEWIN